MHFQKPPFLWISTFDSVLENLRLCGVFVNTFAKTEVFLSIFVQTRSSVNGVLDSLRADSTDSSKSTDSLKRSEVCSPVESAHQQNKACPKSRVVPRLEEPDLIGGKRSLLLSFSLID